MSLPKPHPDAKALSDQLLSQIMNEIKTHGSISFARYMALALYTPQLGYYRNTLKKFGEGGDFVTAPEISPLFSYCLANQCAAILEKLGGGDILEFGAGSGVMAADILIALKKCDQLPNHYYILELSAALQLQQRETIQKKIPDLMDRVVWLNALPDEKMKGVILANEVLDAMPVALFAYQNGIKECAVTIENDALHFCFSPKENCELTDALEKYQLHFENNYFSEINLQLPAWINSVAGVLSEGAAIIIDYGFLRETYYHPDRSQGTLMCHYQHHAHGDPFVYPGLQDITAHVDFTAVGEAAEAAGLEVSSFENQASFLIRHNLLTFIDHNVDEKTRILQNQQIMKLTSPNEMGELFKVMVLSA